MKDTNIKHQYLIFLLTLGFIASVAILWLFFLEDKISAFLKLKCKLYLFRICLSDKESWSLAVHLCVCVCRSVVSDSLLPYGL